MRENLELVRRNYAAWNRGDLEPEPGPRRSREVTGKGEEMLEHPASILREPPATEGEQ